MSLALREAYTARAQTFKQQLELERIGESDSMMKMLGEYMQSLKLGQVDIWKYLGIEGFMQRVDAWRKMGGPGDDDLSIFAGLYSFMRSPYYWELPIQDVSSRLWADLTVKHFPIKSGDSHDIQHLCAAIPVAQYIVADKAMVDRCDRLGIGKKWDTKLFSTRMLDDLCDEINSLQPLPTT